MTHDILKHLRIINSPTLLLFITPSYLFSTTPINLIEMKETDLPKSLNIPLTPNNPQQKNLYILKFRTTTEKKKKEFIRA